MLVVVIAIALALPTFSTAASECLNQDLKENTCSSVTGSIDGDSAVLTGESDADGASDGNGDPSTGAELEPLPCEALLRGCVATISLPVTLADIAAFRPYEGANLMQPNGWAVIGLDTNFYSTGGSQIVDGVLLGQAASVRFTPVAWRWDYGEGQSKTSSSAGGTWAQLGAQEFDPTPGSHVYAARGTYTITLTIDYSAEYRYAGGPWVAITGTLAVASNPLTVTAGNARTVLVNEDCRANPRGPGC